MLGAPNKKAHSVFGIGFLLVYVGGGAGISIPIPRLPRTPRGHEEQKDESLFSIFLRRMDAVIGFADYCNKKPRCDRGALAFYWWRCRDSMGGRDVTCSPSWAYSYKSFCGKDLGSYNILQYFTMFSPRFTLNGHCLGTIQSRIRQYFLLRFLFLIYLSTASMLVSQFLPSLCASNLPCLISKLRYFVE